MNLSIAGYGECGKDTIAEMIVRNFPLTRYQKSTSYVAAKFWWKEIQEGIWSKENIGGISYDLNIFIEKDDYSSMEEFYEDRRTRRQDWVDYIISLNSRNEDNNFLYVETLKESQILTGIRRIDQHIACIPIIDFFIWVERPGCTEDTDTTQEYGMELCDFVIENNGSLEDLEIKVVDLINYLRSNKETLLMEKQSDQNDQPQTT